MDSFLEFNIDGLDALLASTDVFKTDPNFLSAPPGSHNYDSMGSRPLVDQEHCSGWDSSTQSFCIISWKVPLLFFLPCFIANILVVFRLQSSVKRSVISLFNDSEGMTQCTASSSFHRPQFIDGVPLTELFYPNAQSLSFVPLLPTPLDIPLSGAWSPTDSYIIFNLPQCYSHCKKFTLVLNVQNGYNVNFMWMVSSYCESRVSNKTLKDLRRIRTNIVWSFKFINTSNILPPANLQVKNTMNAFDWQRVQKQTSSWTDSRSFQI